MNVGTHDLSKDVLVIAEVGNNHEGDFALAQDLIGHAAKAGAQAVKFQTIIPEELVSADQTVRLEQLEKYKFTYDQFKSLKKTADKEGILFLSTPFDLTSANALNLLVPAFKIASGDNNFFPLLEVVAKTGKPLLISSGLADWAHLENVRDFIMGIWKSENIHQELAILHCVVSYPTPAAEANLRVIQKIATLGVTPGYSDHTLGIESAVLSVALGARVIEKHFTLSKTRSTFRDHQLSADPAELHSLVLRVKEAQLLLGQDKKPADIELSNRIPVRRSIVAIRDLKAGHVLEINDLRWVRPGDGLAPGHEKDIVGKQLKNPLKAGQKILLQDVETPQCVG